VVGSYLICFLRVVSLSHSLDYSIKTVVFVSSIFHRSDRAVCIQNTVGALDDVAISCLPLVLDVTGVGIVNGIAEPILRVSLRQTQATLYLKRSKELTILVHCTLEKVEGSRMHIVDFITGK
jgi:hypothetical protein